LARVSNYEAELLRHHLLSADCRSSRPTGVFRKPRVQHP